METPEDRPEEQEREKIEVHSAWMFDCNKCGRENFIRGVRRESVEEEDGRVDLYVLYPREVVCRFCKKEYETELSG
tara:strand:- start:2055 stop:2282 length:228 start_codon:yes stop_codon:yes gene_type:complete